MKRMKTIALILMCVALVVSCTAVAFADPIAYTITVKANSQDVGAAVDDETYEAYKIFDVSYGEMPDGATAQAGTTGFLYTISPSSPWWNTVTTAGNGTSYASGNVTEFTVDGLHFTRTDRLDGNNQNIYLVTESTNEQGAAFDPAAFASKLYAALGTMSPALTPDDTAIGANGEAELDVTASGAGYYFVTTSVGALCALNTTAPEAEVMEKNDVPTITKEVTNGTDAWNTTGTQTSIGSTVNFRITVSDGKGTDAAITVTDIMTPGLTLHRNGSNQHDITITKNGTAVPSTAYTLTLIAADANEGTGEGFEIVFNPAYVATLTEAATDNIVITYSAELNENAYITGNQLGASNADLRNTNTATLEYQQQSTQRSVTVDTYMFEVVKTTSPTYNQMVLEGAKFKLYDAQTGGNLIPLICVDSTNNVYRVAVGNELATLYPAVGGEADPRATEGVEIEAGVATIIGFGDGDYYLEETQAPDGYNPLTARQPVHINGANLDATLAQNGAAYTSGGVQVINRTGAELPSTGGIGTYLFYGFGALLVVGAVVVLVSKKRMHAYEA